MAKIQSPASLALPRTAKLSDPVVTAAPPKPTAAPPKPTAAPVITAFEGFANRCPSHEEVAAVLLDFPLQNRTGRPLLTDCDPNRGPITSGLVLVNAFRFFGWLRVRSHLLPWRMPLYAPAAGEEQVVDFYGWLRSLQLRFVVAPGNEVLAIARGGGDQVLFNVEAIGSSHSHFEILDTAAAIIHEIRHTSPGGGYPHTCMSAAMERAMAASGGRLDARNSCDPTLSFGGAYNAEYYFWQMLRAHADLFPDRFRPQFESRMAEILEVKICDPTR